MTFHILLHFEQNHCWLLPEIYGRVSETSIYVPGENFWEKKIEKRRFLSNFVLWVKKFGTRVNKFRQGLPKVHSACPGPLLEEIKAREKRMVSKYLSCLEGNFFVLWAKKFLTFWQKICVVFFRTSFYVSRGRFWGKTLLKVMIFL